MARPSFQPWIWMGATFILWLQFFGWEHIEPLLWSKDQSFDRSAMRHLSQEEYTENLAPQSPETPAEKQLEESRASFAVLLMLGLEVTAFLFGYVLKQTHFKYLQEAGATMLFGGLIGGLIRVLSTAERLESVLTFDSQTFFLFLLPPIIFESGYTMKRGNFFKNFGGILLFAMVGTTVAAFITGGLVYAAVEVGFTRDKLNFLECLTFGSLISATDPVTVLAIFKELRVDIDLYSNVFGESVLNDAVAIVLFRTVVGFYSTPLTFGNVILAVLEFLVIFLGSTACGVVVGLLSSLLFKLTQLQKYPNLEMMLLILYAYSSYLLAEGLGLSGIVAILFCGIIMAHYTYHNLSTETKDLSVKFFEIVAGLTETLVFAYLGLALFSFQGEYDFGLIFISLISILIARAAHVFPLSYGINLSRPAHRKIPPKYQFFMWFSGLRGAIAFALSLDVPARPDGDSTYSLAIFTTTLVTAFFTVLVMGGITVPLLEKLGIPIGVSREETGHEYDPADRNLFLNIDRKYLRPFFTRIAYSRFRQQIVNPEHDIELSDVRVSDKPAKPGSPAQSDEATHEIDLDD